MHEIVARMKKRALAGALWFYTGWYAGNMLAFFLGTPELLGPVVGVAAAALFAGDPRHVIWNRPTIQGSVSGLAGEANAA